MGNAESQDVVPNREEHRKELNISRKVSHKQYQKHLMREYSEACIWDLPWSIRDSVALYERFDASFNCISDLPPELPLRLPHLSVINLSHNQVEELPESIGLLFHLKTLMLSHNRLQTLPTSFTKLDQLQKLDLSHNIFRQLPADIGSMQSLQKLNVSYNKLKSLPKSLGQSTTLSLVLASHNRCEDPPQRICNDSSEELLKYLRKTYGNNNDNARAVKLNVFPRNRGNQLQFSAPNTQSAMAEYIQAQTNTTNTPSRIKTPLLPPLDASTLDGDDLRDRILGLIYGAALGDAVGIATENMSADECAFNYDPEVFQLTHTVRDSHRTHWRTGDWTVHFDQMAILLDSLIAWAGVVDELDFASRLAEWTKHGFQELGDTEGYVTSPAMIKVVTSPGFISDPHGVASGILSHLSSEDLEEFADSAALPRAIMMGIPHFHDLAEVKNNSMRICKASHSHPMAISASVFLSALVALVLQGKYALTNMSSVNELIDEAEKNARQVLGSEMSAEELHQHLCNENINDVRETKVERYVLSPLSHAVGALRQGCSWRDAVMQVMMLGGSNSSCNCSIVGALMGAKCGYTALPKSLLDGLRPKQSQWLVTKVNLLLDMLGLP